MSEKKIFHFFGWAALAGTIAQLWEATMSPSEFPYWAKEALFVSTLFCAGMAVYALVRDSALVKNTRDWLLCLAWIGDTPSSKAQLTPPHIALASTLGVKAEPLGQVRDGNLHNVPVEIWAWTFQCKVTITNRSDKSKMSLDVSLSLKMKPPFKPEWILRSDITKPDSILFGRFCPLHSPLPLNPQDSVQGIFYFWTGAMPEEETRENLINYIERNKDGWPLAELEIRDLVSNEVIRVKIPTEDGWADILRQIPQP